MLSALSLFSRFGSFYFVLTSDFIKSVTIRAAMFTRVNGTISCFCNKHLQNRPTVYTNFSNDKRLGLLIAFPNEKIIS